MLAKLKAMFAADAADNINVSSEQSRRLACAAMMVEVATIDRQFDESESRAMMNILKTQFSLSDTDVTALIEHAERARHEATSLHEFTRDINLHCDASTKLDLIKGMWRVAYADGELDKYEEHIIRRAADLIHVGHNDFIRAKLDVKNSLNLP